jgi:hypothetical protein
MVQQNDVFFLTVKTPRLSSLYDKNMASSIIVQLSVDLLLLTTNGRVECWFVWLCSADSDSRLRDRCLSM